MTFLGWLGRKTTKQSQINKKEKKEEIKIWASIAKMRLAFSQLKSSRLALEYIKWALKQIDETKLNQKCQA